MFEMALWSGQGWDATQQRWWRSWRQERCRLSGVYEPVQCTPIWAEALGNRKGMTFLGASSRRCLGRAGRATAVANTGRRASAQSGCPQNLRTAYSLGRFDDCQWASGDLFPSGMESAPPTWLG